MYWFHPNEAHNGYLEVFLNLGWTGVALLALVMIKGYRNSASAFRRDPELGRLRLAYFLAGAAYSFTEAGFRLMNPVWIVFLFSITVVPEAVAAEAPEVSEDVHRSQRCEQPQLAPEYVYEEVV
jgi:O-antigen ligase